MPTPPFKMSDATRQAFLASIESLSTENQRKLIETLSTLCAEVEVHTRSKMLEELRQEWGTTLSTMFLINPALNQKNKRK